MSEPSPIVTVLIPLPLNYNPDKDGNRLPVEDEKFRVTATEIAERFRAGGTLYRFRHDPPCGFWWHKGIVGDDVLALLEIDILDSQENRKWVESYALHVLLARFGQNAIYIKFVLPVERLLVQEVKVLEDQID